jgi:hypothetical protein
VTAASGKAVVSFVGGDKRLEEPGAIDTSLTRMGTVSGCGQPCGSRICHEDEKNPSAIWHENSVTPQVERSPSAMQSENLHGGACVGADGRCSPDQLEAIEAATGVSSSMRNSSTCIGVRYVK